LVLQISPVHGEPSSSGTSPFMFTVITPPAPSHWSSLQSPGICEGVGVPIGVKLVPHALAMHVRALQLSSMPGHCAGALHCTHVAAALQKLPPFWLHG